MVTIAQSLGLTGDELLALRWRDVDFEENLLLVSRNLADARRSDHRTEDSKKRLVVHDALLQVLLDWSDRCPLTEEGWIFADPSTDQPYMSSEIEVGYLAPAGVRLGLGPVGWHSLRQTYGSLLDNAATPVLLQQDLLQHLWTAGPGL
jgi:integrase